MTKAIEAHTLPSEVQAIRKDIIEGSFGGEPISFGRLKTQIPEGFMTIAMLREATGLTVVETRRLISNGQLVPVRKSDLGWALYDQSTIESLRVRPQGRTKRTKITCAQRRMTHSYSQTEGLAVFEHIKKGTPGPEIVLTVGLHPAVVAQIMRDWTVIANGAFLDGTMLERINALEGQLHGRFPVKPGDAEAIVFLLETVARKQLCSCGRRAKKLCSYCAEEKYDT